MDRRLEKALEGARNLAKRKPSFTEEDLFSIFSLEGLTEEEGEGLLAVLADEGIAPKNPPSEDADLDEAEMRPLSSDNPLSPYYEKMAAYPPLSERDLNSLIEKAREIPSLEKGLEDAKGDKDALSSASSRLKEAEEAREKAVYSNLRLAWSLAKRYAASSSLSFQDLLQEGILGLGKAVDRFDPKRGTRFSTYAYYWIEESLRSAISEEKGSVRLPERVLDQNRLVRAASDRLVQSLGREPTVSEIAKETGIDEKEVAEAMEALQSAVSLDDPLGDPEGDSFLSVIGDPEAGPLSSGLDEEDYSHGIKTALEVLSDREKDIISRNFGLGEREAESLESIGRSYGISRERARQIREGALEKMNKALRKGEDR